MMPLLVFLKLGLAIIIIAIAVIFIRGGLREDRDIIRKLTYVFMITFSFCLIGMSMNIVVVLSNGFMMPVVLDPHEHPDDYMDTKQHFKVRSFEGLKFKSLVDRYNTWLGKVSLGDFFIFAGFVANTFVISTMLIRYKMQNKKI